MTDEFQTEPERIQRLEQRVERLEGNTGTGSSGRGGPASATRRQMLGGLGVGGLLLGGAGTVSAAPYDDDLGGARFVGRDESLQYAVDNSSLVFVTSAYDSSEDTFPITIDSEVTVIGDGNGYITNPGTEATIEIATGSERPNAVSLQNLSINGGDPGLLVESSKFCELSNVHVRNTDGHGILVRDASASVNSLDLYHTSVQRSDGDGIHVTGRSHSTNLFGVRTIEAGRHGVTITASHAVNMIGCQFEDSQGYGLRMEGLSDATVFGAYVEGNKVDSSVGDRSAEIYADGCVGLSIDHGYGNPLDDPLTSFVYLQDCHTVNVLGTRIKSGYDYLVDGPTPAEYEDDPDVDFADVENRRLNVYRASHYPAYGERVVSDPAIAKRVRSDGTLLSRDLDRINGQHAGEIGVHDYDGTPELRVWDGDDWV